MEKNLLWLSWNSHWPQVCEATTNKKQEDFWKKANSEWASVGQSLAAPHVPKDFLVAQMVKNLPEIWQVWVPSLGWEDPLEKSMTTHSNILAWRIPMDGAPGALQSMGSQRVTTEWLSTSQHSMCPHIHRLQRPGGRSSRWWQESQLCRSFRKIYIYKGVCIRGCCLCSFWNKPRNWNFGRQLMGEF